MAKLTREQVEQIVREARKKGQRPDLRRVDLSKAYLDKADLSGADLSGANLKHTFLDEAILDEARLCNAMLNDVKLFHANLSGANLRGAKLIRADLRGADLSETNLKEADLREAKLTFVNLTEATFSWADLRKADFFRAKLVKTNFSRANLSRANLSGANLSGANLSRANLSGANLSRADLIEVDLLAANLREASFLGSRLFGTNFSEVDLRETDFTEANLCGAIFANVDLSNVRGLDTIKHEGPTYLDLQTIQHSQGKIPDVFLRGCGVNETFITYINSLPGKAIEYYSCFISYSSHDQAFAERLHADLQSKGVRCWFAPEDIKIGAKIRHSIDQAIRIHDKLLLVLSEQSVASQWVEHEVEHALDLEIERGELVLFPIRLDQAIMRSRTGWAGNIKRGRHIGDFTQWKEHDAYQRAFERLLRDLKTEEPLPLPPHLAAESAKHKRKESLQIQLARHYSNVNKLREQAAIYEAGAKPLHLLNQIEAEEKQIADIEAELEALQGE